MLRRRFLAAFPSGCQRPHVGWASPPPDALDAEFGDDIVRLRPKQRSIGG